MNLFGLHLDQPLWLLILPLLLLVGAWVLKARGFNPWQKVIDEALWRQMGGRTGQRVTAWLALAVWAVCSLLIAVALAGPAWNQVANPMTRQQPTWVLALDLSRNMLAVDVSPTRLDRARFKLYDLLEAEPEARFALVGWAGEAFTVAPLTDDAATVSNLLSALSPDIMPVQGQRPDRGLAAAGDMLEGAGLGQGDVLLITNRATGLAIAKAAELRRAGHRVHVLAVGTSSGAPVPGADGGFLGDDNGQLRMSTLERESLERLAEAGGGEVISMTTDQSDIDRIVEQLSSGQGESAGDSDGGLRWQNQGPLVLLLALPLVALVFRRGVLLILLLGFFPMLASPPAMASLWQRLDQQAWQALQQEPESIEIDPSTAELDPELAGALAYRKGDYQQAEQLFEQGSSARAHYNRGNALAMQGRREAAMEAYDQALELDPNLEDAAYNRDLLAQQEPPEQQSQQNDNDQSDDDSEQEQEGEQNQEGEQGQQGEQNESRDDEQAQSSDSSDESDSADSESSDGSPDSDQQSDGQPEDDGQQQDGAESDESEQGDSSDQTAGEEDQVSAPESLPDDTETEQAEPEPAEPQDQASDGEATETPRRQAEAGEAPEGDERGAEADFSEMDPERRALERQLMRLPDDPGRLLRNKFRRDLELRRRHGLPVEEPD